MGDDTSAKVREFEVRIAAATFENIGDVLYDIVQALVNNELTPKDGRKLNRIGSRKAKELKAEAFAALDAERK